MQQLRGPYWLLTGALIAFGGLAILSIGIPFLAAGVVLLMTGLFLYRARQVWLVIVGFGVVGTGMLAFDLLTAPPECLANGSMPPGAQVCSGSLTTYRIMAVGFVAVLVAGLAWPLGRWQVSRGRSRG